MERLVAEIVQMDGVAGEREFLGDAMPHEASAHHGDAANVIDVRVFRPLSAVESLVAPPTG